jgi:hypothetical protein
MFGYSCQNLFNDMSKYELDARFVYGPKHSHFPESKLETVSDTLRSVITSHQETKEVREVLDQFPHLKAFQNALGKITGLDSYDPKIQEAYWIGNDLLKSVDRSDAREVLLHYYKKSELPASYMNELEGALSKPVILHHNFQVAKIAVIDSGGMGDRLEPVNNCMVRSAEVWEVSDDRVKVNAVKLCKNQYGFVLEKKDEIVKYEQNLVGDLKVGNKVALHWGAVAMQLKGDQEKQLDYWTQEVAKIL